MLEFRRILLGDKWLEDWCQLVGWQALAAIVLTAIGGARWFMKNFLVPSVLGGYYSTRLWILRQLLLGTFPSSVN